jgi:YHS domain-containing protein
MKRYGSIFLGVIAAWSMPAQAGEVNTGYFGNVAIEGYDTVAYFTEKRAVKGSEKFQSEWLGATWQFSSAENRNRFDASPMDYAPQLSRDDGQH